MNLLNKVKLFSAHYYTCKIVASAPLKTVHCLPYRLKATSGPVPCQNIVVANLCEKLKCTESIANTIYDQYTTLRSIDAIQNDSLQLLRTKLSPLSVIENPELITLDFGENL